MSARAKRVIAYGLAIAALVAVFVLYTRPEMMVTLGNLVWACFN